MFLKHWDKTGSSGDDYVHCMTLYMLGPEPEQ